MSLHKLIAKDSRPRLASIISGSALAHCLACGSADGRQTVEAITQVGPEIVDVLASDAQP